MIDRAINLISVLGVIVSLIFVGLEVRQAHTIALATQAQARLEQQLDRNRTWFEGQWERAIPLQQHLTTNSAIQRDGPGIKI